MHYPHGNQVRLTMKALMIFEVPEQRQVFDGLISQSGRVRCRSNSQISLDLYIW